MYACCIKDVSNAEKMRDPVLAWVHYLPEGATINPQRLGAEHAHIFTKKKDALALAEKINLGQRDWLATH